METFNSQEFADYFNEYRVIEVGEKSDDSLDEDYKSEDFAESEWLHKIGVNPAELITDDGEKEFDDSLVSELLSSLTHRQATIVRKKIASYKATVRKGRKSKSRIPDVRDVFPQNSESSGSDARSRSETPDSLDSLSPRDSSPSSPDWVPQPISGSPTSNSSQGYHSRASSNSILSSYSAVTTVTHWKSPNTKSLKYYYENDNKFQSSDSDWEKVGEVTDGNCFSGTTINSVEQFGKPPPSPSPQQQQAVKEVSFQKPRRHKIDQLPRNEDSVTGVQIKGYQNYGSYYGGPRGLHIGTLPSHIELSEGDVSIDVREDVELEWDFELCNSDASGDDISMFRAVPDKLGTTHINDLDIDDVGRIQTLSLLEFTILCDVYHLQCFKRKQRKKKRKDEHAVFEVPLTTLLERDRRLSPHCKIPLVLEAILNYLELYGLRVEGILRVPGSSHKTDVLKMELEHNFYTNRASVEKAFQNCSPNDVVSILKYFIRGLPNPLFTSELVESFFQLYKISVPMDQLKMMKLLVLQLPEAHRNTVWALLTFLSRVADNEKYNRMTLQNISMVMAPNLFLAKAVGREKRDLEAEMAVATATCRMTKLMIKYREIVFSVPSFMLKQIRVQRETEANRRNAKENNPMKWLLKKPSRADIYRKINNEVDYQDGIIRLQAPQFNIYNHPLKLELVTTSLEVVTAVLKVVVHKISPSEIRDRVHGRMEARKIFTDLTQNGHSTCFMNASDLESLVKNHYLYEVGGNIGERRLPHDTCVMAVYQENPNADWIIKCHHLNLPSTNSLQQKN